MYHTSRNLFYSMYFVTEKRTNNGHITILTPVIILPLNQYLNFKEIFEKLRRYLLLLQTIGVGWPKRFYEEPVGLKTYCCRKYRFKKLPLHLFSSISKVNK